MANALPTPAIAIDDIGTTECIKNRIVVELSSAGVPLRLSMTVYEAMNLHIALKRAVVDFHNAQQQRHEGEVLAFPKKRRKAGRA